MFLTESFFLSLLDTDFLINSGNTGHDAGGGSPQ